MTQAMPSCLSCPKNSWFNNITMMNRSRRKILILLISIASASMLYAGRDANLEPATPTHWYIGGFAGINSNSHTGTYGLYDDNRPCCTFNSGSGVGVVLGVKAFIPLTERISFEPRVVFEGRGGTLKGSAYEQSIRGQNNQVELASYQDELVTTLPYLCVDALADYIVIPKYGLYVCAGFSMGMAISTSYTQYENILGPADVTYVNSGLTRQEVNSAKLPDFQSFQFGVRFGLGANIHLKNKLYLSPEVLYTIPFTSYSSNAGTAWKSTQLQPTLGICFQL